MIFGPLATAPDPQARTPPWQVSSKKHTLSAKGEGQSPNRKVGAMMGAQWQWLQTLREQKEPLGYMFKWPSRGRWHRSHKMKLVEHSKIMSFSASELQHAEVPKFETASAADTICHTTKNRGSFLGSHKPAAVLGGALNRFIGQFTLPTISTWWLKQLKMTSLNIQLMHIQVVL